MPLRLKWNLFLIFWLLLLLSGPITVLKNTFPSTLADPIVIANLFQRITGLLAFTLIFIQIVLGAFLGGWTQVIGARAYKFHIIQGLFAYGFILIHPLFENIITYQVSKSFVDALSVFIPRFETQRDIYLVFGRSAFVLATISVSAAYFRTKPFFRRNWKAFHILNYLVFFLVYLHARLLGSDLQTFPFLIIFRLSPYIAALTIFYKILPLISKRLHFLTKADLSEKT